METLPVKNNNQKITKKFEVGKLEFLFKSFLANHKKSTALEYRNAAKDFFSFIVSNDSEFKSIENLTRHHLIFYRKYLEGKKASNKTILKKLSGISSLCKFLAAEGLIDKDIVYGIQRPKTHNKKETADLSDVDVKAIFNSFDLKSFYFYSHRAIFAVGLYTGLRSHEIRNLKIRNFGEVAGHRVLNLSIKGDKPHEIPLNPFVVRCILEHIDKLKELGFKVNDDHYLFPSLKTRQNKPMAAKPFSFIFQRRLKMANVEQSHLRRYSPHSMRATFAGHLLNTVEAPLEEVQKLLGHSSPTTTQKYNKRKKSHDKSPVYKIQY